jgi:hypothetical protein
VDTFFNYYVPQHKFRGADFLPGLAREYAQQLNQGLGERDGVKEEAERAGKQRKEGSTERAKITSKI